MKRMMAVLASLMCVLAIGLSMSSAASATGTVVWGFGFCKLVAPGTGGWTNACTTPVNGGEWAYAVLTLTGLVGICRWLGVGNGMFDDSNCQFLGGIFGYYPLWDPPALSIKIKGGAYKMKSTVAGEKVTIACTGMEAKEPEFASDGGKAAGESEESSLQYSGCSVETPSKCEVGNVGGSAKAINTNAVESKLVENSTKSKVEQVFKPKTGSVFYEIEFKNKGSETCVLKGIKAKVEGSTLTEGGKEDEISSVDKIKLEEGLGTEEEGESVEKPKLISEPSNKKYFNDETESEAEAKLTLLAEGKAEAFTLLGEAKSEDHFEGATFKGEEGGEETVLEGPLDESIERE